MGKIIILLSILAGPTVFADGLKTTDLSGKKASEMSASTDSRKAQLALQELARNLKASGRSGASGAESKDILGALGEEWDSLREQLKTIKKHQEEKKEFIEELQKDL